MPDELRLRSENDLDNRFPPRFKIHANEAYQLLALWS